MYLAMARPMASKYKRLKRALCGLLRTRIDGNLGVNLGKAISTLRRDIARCDKRAECSRERKLIVLNAHKLQLA